MSRPLLTGEMDAVPIIQESGWAPEMVWNGEENVGRQWTIKK